MNRYIQTDKNCHLLGSARIIPRQRTIVMLYGDDSSPIIYKRFVIAKTRFDISLLKDPPYFFIYFSFYFFSDFTVILVCMMSFSFRLRHRVHLSQSFQHSASSKRVRIRSDSIRRKRQSTEKTLFDKFRFNVKEF